MKAVILAGGLGTRIAEESDYRPKPMIEVGGLPLFWHLMNLYSHHGVNDFVICLEDKGHVIKEFFLDYPRFTSDLRIQLGTHEVTVLDSKTEDWTVTLVDTGKDTMTGGRLKRIGHLVGDEDFCLTYGDGIADVDIGSEIAFHKAHGKLATVTAVQPPGRFGILELGKDSVVERFQEKPRDEIGWINGGFFVLNPAVLKTIEGDQTSWEQEPLRRLATEGQLVAFRHTGFWQPCDTLRDKRVLEDAWNTGSPPWRVWSD